MNGFYLSDSECLACHPNCSSCLSIDSCTSCFEMSYLDSGKCLQNPAGCQHFNSTLKKCSKCYFPLFLNSSGECSLCSSHCTTCLSTVHCLKCESDFILKSFQCLKGSSSISPRSMTSVLILLTCLSLLILLLSVICMVSDYLKSTPSEISL
jgi:hypothetical protein